MPYETIARKDWAAFVEAFSAQLEGQRVEIEIMGIDLGVQIEAPWLPLRGLSFEPLAETLHIHLADGHHIDHAITSPVELWAEIEGGELRSLAVLDRDEHKQILRFRSPLQLPAAIGDRGSEGASPM